MRKHTFRFMAGILAALLLLSGCGSKNSYSGSGAYDNNYMVAETRAAAAAAPMAMEDHVMGMAAKEGDYAPLAYEETAAENSSGSSGLNESDLAGSNTLQNSRKLIRTVDLSLQTTEYDLVTETIRRRVTELGGYIEQSNAYNGGYYGRSGRSMHLTARIPNDRLDEFLDTSLEHAKVTNRTERTEDVTLKYTDMEARVKTLEVERDRLMELLAQAENIESIIALENRLSDIRYELESIQSSLRVYDNQVAYSTAIIAIDEVSVVSQPKQATFGERISAGFQQSMLDVVEALGDLLVGIISNLPMILFILVVLALFFIIMKKLVIGIPRGVKRHREKRKAKKAAEKAAVEKTAVDKPAAENAAVNPAEPGSAEKTGKTSESKE